MTEQAINHYLVQLTSAIEEQNGAKASKYLSMKDLHIMNDDLHVEDASQICNEFFDVPFNDISSGHLRCVWSLAKGNIMEAFTCQSLVTRGILKLLQTCPEENWALPIMYAVCIDLRRIAYFANKEMTNRGRTKPGEILEKAADQIMSLFRICASDGRAQIENSKKWGMLHLVNQLLKIYFKINKLKLCDALIKAIDNSSLKDKFTLAQLVTYRYYVGKKAMFDGNYKIAEEFLLFAFERCHKDCRNNKRVILIYLIPVKLLVGAMASTTLLQKYDLLQFQPVCDAVKTGDLVKLNEALEEHETFFIQWGIYLILEKLKFLTYRNLFKKVYLILGTHQLPISAFTHTLRLMQVEDIDDEESQCIIANLINQGQIKGYISYQHNKLVVSKQNAFPQLSSIL